MVEEGRRVIKRGREKRGGTGTRNLRDELRVTCRV